MSNAVNAVDSIGLALWFLYTPFSGHSLGLVARCVYYSDYLPVPCSSSFLVLFLAAFCIFFFTLLLLIYFFALHASFSAFLAFLHFSHLFFVISGSRASRISG